MEKLDGLTSIFHYNTPPGAVHPSERVEGWDLKFISDVTVHTLNGSALSTAQAKVAIKILNKYVELFSVPEQADLLDLLNTPRYRKPLHISLDFPRQVRWAGGSILLFRFKFNAQVADSLRTLKCEFEETVPTRIYDYRAWRVVVDNVNYERVMNIIKRHNFEFDDNVSMLFYNIENNLENSSEIRVTDTQIEVDINNDTFACLWLADMEWLKDV